MKRLGLFLLAVVMIGVVGCGGGSDTTDSNSEADMQGKWLVTVDDGTTFHMQLSSESGLVWGYIWGAVGGSDVSGTISGFDVALLIDRVSQNGGPAFNYTCAVKNEGDTFSGTCTSATEENIPTTGVRVSGQ